MSILLESRNQNRGSESEALVQQQQQQQQEQQQQQQQQQPATPFYNGNSSASIWGRSTGSMGSFWQMSSDSVLNGAAPSPFDFGFSSQAKDSGTTVSPPPVEVLQFEKPAAASNDPQVFVFGSSSSSASRSNDRAASSFSRASLSLRSSRQKVEQVETLLHNMRIDPDPASAAAVSSVADEQASQGIPQTFSEVEGKSFAKTFAVGSGGVTMTQPTTTAYQQPTNPRPRFSKLRKSTHQAKGKGVADGEAVISSQDVLGSEGSGLSSSTPSVRSASPDPVNFHTGEPSIPSTDAVKETGSDRQENNDEAEEHRKIGFMPWFQAEEAEAEATTFTFTAMRNSVPVIPEAQELSEEAKSVAADLSGLKLGQDASCGQHTFAFNAGIQRQTEASSAAMEGGNSDSFVFRASGNAPSTATLNKKKKDKSKKTPGRLIRQIRSSSSISASDEQGSPMDLSPCPETGARMSPPLTATNSESEEQERSSAQYGERAEAVEDLRAAAAELNLGNPEFVKENFMFNGSESFSFSSSNSSASAPKRRTRRAVRSGVSKAKNSVTRPRPPSVLNKDEYEMDVDKNKLDVGTQSSVSIQPTDYALPSVSTTSTRAAVEQACEKWRLRGNQAYANGDFPKAEEYYSRGASSVPPNETSQSCIRASMLCYSNRAATRMVVGRMREALADCKRAMSVDPNFLRVRLRAGSCYLALGDNESAASYFKDCLFRARDHDRNDLKIASEASEGLRKTQQAQDYYKRICELSSENDFTAALRLLNEALSASPYSETLLELKARCLLSVRKFDEALGMCAQTLSSAESNWSIRGFESGTPKAWRAWVTSKALFYLGQLEESLACLQKLGDELSLSGAEKISQVLGADVESFSQFNALLHDLLRHKAAGNEAFQAGRHAEAVEHYTAALACNSEARPFIAVLFCNRAAASQALGHIADAIADSSRAVVLDPNYAKAISRRATLHTLIRDYGQSCIDLRRLTSLFPEQQAKQENSRKAGQDLKQARERLATAEEDLKRNHPIDHYLILGLEPSCTAVEIKKAYRKLALRHHPDKAGQLLVRGDGGEDGSWWKEAGNEIRHDAERLFKLIGEAYAILSDPSKRARYDAEEELRKLRTRGVNCSAENSYRYHPQQSYERTGRRQRDRWDNNSWTGYTQQYQRWQSAPDAAQPDTYARFSRHGSGRSADFNWDDL